MSPRSPKPVPQISRIDPNDTWDYERYGFLELEMEEGPIIVVGGIEPFLLNVLLQKGTEVVWIEDDLRRRERVERYLGPRENLIWKESLFYGEDVQPEKAQTLIVLWALPKRERWDEWVMRWQNILGPGGKALVIIPADRPALSSQQLTRRLINLGRSLEEGELKEWDWSTTGEHLQKELENHHFWGVRNRVFNDPDLIASSEFWLFERDRLESLVQNSRAQWEDDQWMEVLKEWEEINRGSSREPLSTPPFQLITATNRCAQEKREVNYSGKTDSSTHDQWDTEHIIWDQFYSGEQSTPSSPSVFVKSEVTEKKRQDDADGLIRRLLEGGAHSLKMADLLEVILESSQLGGEDRTALYQRLVSDYNLELFKNESSPSRMAELLEIPVSLASRLVALFELGRRLFEVPSQGKPFIRSPQEAYEYLREMGSWKKEHLRGLYLNIQSRLLHQEIISIGSLERASIHPREVFSPAMEYAAYSLILAHNHPSGDPTPSQTDIHLTRQISQAGRIMGIELLDHLIIGSQGFVSMKEEGLF